MNPMKNKLIQLSILFTVCLAYLIPLNCYSQASKSVKAKNASDTAHSFVKLDKITKYYSESELNKLPKLALIEIYKARLVYLIEILPFISLHPTPGSTFHDMSIPETDANIAHLDKEAKNKQAFIGSLSQTLDDVVPYSEKTNIIWSILFFDEMIKKSDYTK
jgi:hypothetical protein